MKKAANITSISDLQAIIDVMPLPVLIKNSDHRIVLINDAACQFFGHSREVMLGFSDTDLFPDEEVEVFHANDDRVFETGVLSENEEQVTDARGQPRTVITRKRRVTLNDEYYLVATVTDVTAYREAEAHSHYLAFHDTLTGLPNRALLNERIDQTLLRRRRTDERCALLYIDLDRFKEVNDTYGHQAGDALIQAFAARLTSIVRASDTVSRLGGDEFAVLLVDRGEDADVEIVCNRILEAGAEPFEIEGGRVFLSASVGVADAVEELDNIEFQRRADVALYQAKREGRACFRRFTSELDERIRRIRRLEKDLRESLAKESGLEVHYQPLFNTAGESLAGMEALVRWHHPEFGLLQPEEFIPIAEETGLIVPLGEWVLTQACTMMAQWPDLVLAVNLSPVQIREDNLVDRVLAILRQTGFKPSKLELELTEGAILDTDGMVRDQLKKLRAVGIRIVLDDFGTGYSSLTHLQKLDIDKVKIDKSFVQDIIKNGESEAIVHAVTYLARVLGIPVTAEGVETKTQHDLLGIIGCSEMQGFFYSQPMSPEDTRRFLTDKTKWTRVA
ncbi:diguanylate cyclase (GGDEF)-like protein/PAS domain S-box-containing protein [Parvibaculum indicum]|uniref:putative bifunctional diguanylate cyclase/phosphodiesterase n=1 Tax=Parvibaculum indicum TaxID=562969 RepID=UPI001421DE2F|nr:GGDEF and EAL domain-containing protein [Parvibaculum indicum]NIJ39756.1 diguanylate cyclase (GGDEF)-like protein/PAS domain S-box-containing protein [Parvibaculum indicum]